MTIGATTLAALQVRAPGADAASITPHATYSNLVACFRAQFENYAKIRSFIFLSESGRRMIEQITTFADLDRGAREIAAWLRSRPEAQRPVLLLYEPGVEFWRAFLGCIYAGYVGVDPAVGAEAA